MNWQNVDWPLIMFGVFCILFGIVTIWFPVFIAPWAKSWPFVGGVMMGCGGAAIAGTIYFDGMEDKP